MAAAATVIIPTYGKAPFLRQALASVQRQTVRELEICVVCDGVSNELLEMLEKIAASDSRVMVWVNPKAPRTGEVHRPAAIAATTAPVICYLGHDDLWFSHHVSTMIRLLQNADFGHTLHCEGGLGRERFVAQRFLYGDLSSRETAQAMLDPARNYNIVGLTFAGHTREAYQRLAEGWNTAPEGVPTDLHMWRKFLRAPWCRCVSHLGVTALHFAKAYRSQLFSDEAFAAELERYLAVMAAPDLLQELHAAALGGLFRYQRDMLGECRPGLSGETVRQLILTTPCNDFWSRCWRLLKRRLRIGF
ncbi:glycosyltransferase family A protein [Desulfoferula mesophila]|uniref:Glycosyltransferase 2-like domain-containing protein n=1 Tax=Desulfoferula mesophila TaxID=3058419 RepID=A0AAU9E9I1_9BACT|nr:hypothetical protein FAK_06260 [Desulfoferula mesophilus]